MIKSLQDHLSCDLEWLQSIRRQISINSKPLRHLRQQLVKELYNRLTNSHKPLRDWTLQDRIDLCNSIESFVRLNYPDLVQSVQEDVGEIFHSYFNAHVDTKMNRNERDSLSNRISLAIEESEKAACKLLTKWPDLSSTLKCSLNTNLSMNLRIVAYKSILMNPCLNHEIQQTLNSNEFKQFKLMNTLIYSSCQNFLSQVPNLQQVASIFSCIKKLEMCCLFLTFEQDANLETDCWKRRLSLLALFIKVFEYDRIKQCNQMDNQEPIENLLEMFITFWNKLPDHLKTEDDFTWDKLSFQVEKTLLQVDPALHSHLAKLALEDDGQDGIKSTLQQLLRFFFVDTCSLSVCTFMLDQILIGSQEMNGDSTLPNIDILLSWFTIAVMLIVKDSILMCRKLSHVYHLIKSQIPLQVTVALLQQILHENFIGKLAQRIHQNQEYSKISCGVPGYVLNNLQIDLYWDQEVEEIDENQLVLWEKTSLDPYKLEYERFQMRQRIDKEQRLDSLMQKWRTFAKYLGWWNIYFNSLFDQVRTRHRNLKEIHDQFVKPCITPAVSLASIESIKQDPTPIIASDSSISIKKPPTPKPKIVVIQPKKALKKPIIRKKSITKPKQKPIPIPTQKTVPIIPTLPMRQNSLCVMPNCHLGREHEKLTPIGYLLTNTIQSIYSVLGGTLKPGIFPKIAESILFEKHFESDLRMTCDQLNQADLSKMKPDKINQFWDAFDKNKKQRIKSHQENAEFIQEEIKEKDKILSSIANCHYNQDLLVKNKIQSLPGIVSLICDQINAIFRHPEQDCIKSSLEMESRFNSDAEYCQLKVWKQTLPLQSIFEWVAPDKDDEDQAELGRRKKREQYLKMLDDIYFGRKKK